MSTNFGSVDQLGRINLCFLLMYNRDFVVRQWCVQSRRSLLVKLLCLLIFIFYLFFYFVRKVRMTVMGTQMFDIFSCSLVRSWNHPNQALNITLTTLVLSVALWLQPVHLSLTISTGSKPVPIVGAGMWRGDKVTILKKSWRHKTPSCLPRYVLGMLIEPDWDSSH